MRAEHLARPFRRLGPSRPYRRAGQQRQGLRHTAMMASIRRLMPPRRARPDERPSAASHLDADHFRAAPKDPCGPGPASARQAASSSPDAVKLGSRVGPGRIAGPALRMSAGWSWYIGRRIETRRDAAHKQRADRSPRRPSVRPTVGGYRLLPECPPPRRLARAADRQGKHPSDVTIFAS